MNILSLAICLLLVGTLCLPPYAFAEEYEYDETQKALTALFASANDVIPETSTCYSDYGLYGQSKLTIKDMLANLLAQVYPQGKTTIRGKCGMPRHRDNVPFWSLECVIDLGSNAGEPTWFETISFNLKKGRANPATLQCGGS
jgi:hypothetical protein